MIVNYELFFFLHVQMLQNFYKKKEKGGESILGLQVPHANQTLKRCVMIKQFFWLPIP